jgi:hypothetical protein
MRNSADEKMYNKADSTQVVALAGFDRLRNLNASSPQGMRLIPPGSEDEQIELSGYLCGDSSGCLHGCPRSHLRGHLRGYLRGYLHGYLAYI